MKNAGETAKEAVQEPALDDFLSKVDAGLISADGMIKNLTSSAGDVVQTFKPQQIGLGLPPKETAFSMTKASYQDYAPRLIDGWQLKLGTPTLKIYNRGNDMVVSARGTRPSDPNDLKADALIPASQLGLSDRMRGDLATLKQFQRRFPPTKYSYSGVGHSLGGAIIDEFIKQGLVKDGRTYNPAVTTMDWDRPIPNHRVYMDADPLYQLMGSHTKNPEVRHYTPKQPTSFFGRVASMFPVARDALQTLDAHNLDNFTGGGTHKQNFLKANKLEDKGYSLEELAKISGVPLETLQEVYNRGVGAYKTQPKSVRLKGSFMKNVDAPMKKKLSKEQWGLARVYSYLDGNPKHDNDLRRNGSGTSSSKIIPPDQVVKGEAWAEPTVKFRIVVGEYPTDPLITVYSEFINDNFPMGFQKFDSWEALQKSAYYDKLTEAQKNDTLKAVLYRKKVWGQHIVGKGATKSLLKDAGLTPQTYLEKVKQNAKGKGIDPSKLFLANDGVHKLMYKDDNRTSKFGRVGYGDFIIWSELEHLKKVPAGYSHQKRNTFHSSHSKIKGDWRQDPLSPNNLALKVLW